MFHFSVDYNGKLDAYNVLHRSCHFIKHSKYLVEISIHITTEVVNLRRHCNFGPGPEVIKLFFVPDQMHR